MKSIYLFRHGETDFNRDGRFQGHLDVPLNETGRSQARVLGQKLREKGVEAMLSSDLARARETAELVAVALGLAPSLVRLDAGLREAHLGEIQGLNASEIHAKVGVDLMERWRSSHPTDADVAYPGGESGRSVGDRVFVALEAALLSSPARTWAVSTHGGVIRRIMHRLLPPHSPPVRIPNTIVYLLEFDDQAKRWQVPRADPIFWGTIEPLG